MGKLFHFHPFIGTASGCCTVTQHHVDCSRWGLTPANEISCVFRKGVPAPENRPCKCSHSVPDAIFKSLKIPSGYELWAIPKGMQFKITQKQRARLETKKIKLRPR